MPRGWKVMFAPTTEEAAEEASQFRFCRMDSDLILVLDHGAVVEQGTHQTLLAKKGFYYKLYTSQYAV